MNVTPQISQQRVEGSIMPAASERLEALQKVVQAARNAVHQHESLYINGLNDGLEIALNAIERELQYSRQYELAVARFKQ
jgi:hypothetical protein